MKKKWWWLSGIVVIVVSLQIFGPYNIYYEFNEKRVLSDIISSDHTFKGNPIVEVDYKGGDTFHVQVEDNGDLQHYIVMRTYTSVMNGDWKVFKQVGEEKF